MTEILVAMARLTDKRALAGPIISSLKTARIVPGAAVDQFAGLLFSAQPKAPYQFAKRLSGIVVFTHNGAFPLPVPTAPLFAVGSSLGQPATADKEAFAKYRVTQIDTLRNISVYDSKKMTLDGMEGIQLLAMASHAKTNVPMLVYQVMLFDKDVYYLMQGIATTQESKTELALWSEMVKTFKRKANPPDNPQ